jgi:hypothetical protein
MNLQSRIATVILLVLATSSKSEEIELTGAADFFGTRMAFVSVRGQTATLRPGESAFGFTLQDFNPKEGWAEFLRGTNKVVVHLSSPTSSSKPDAGGSTERPDLQGRNKTRLASANDVLQPAPAGSEGMASEVPVGPGDSALNFASAGNPFVFSGVRNNTGLSAASPLPPPTSTASENVAAVDPTRSSQPSAASLTGNDPVAAPNASTGSLAQSPSRLSTESAAPPQPTRLINSEPDPAYLEGQRILGFYGEAAFEAWDLQRGQHPNPTGH